MYYLLIAQFVRIKPDSLLEKLYPPTQHGLDKCLLCGLSFHDHLTCWWYPQLYSSYDTYLDDIQRNGTVSWNEYYDSLYSKGSHRRHRINKNKFGRKSSGSRKQKYGTYSTKSSQQHQQHQGYIEQYGSTLNSPFYHLYERSNSNHHHQHAKHVYHQQYVDEIQNNVPTNKKQRSRNRKVQNQHQQPQQHIK